MLELRLETRSGSHTERVSGLKADQSRFMRLARGMTEKLTKSCSRGGSERSESSTENVTGCLSRWQEQLAREQRAMDDEGCRSQSVHRAAEVSIARPPP